MSWLSASICCVVCARYLLFARVAARWQWAGTHATSLRVLARRVPTARPLCQERGDRGEDISLPYQHGPRAACEPLYPPASSRTALGLVVHRGGCASHGARARGVRVGAHARVGPRTRVGSEIYYRIPTPLDIKAQIARRERRGAPPRVSLNPVISGRQGEDRTTIRL